MSGEMRIGLIGCGNISTAYLRLAPLFAGLRMVAVADLRPELAQAQAAAFELRAMSVEALLAADDIDLVVNLTVPKAHAQVTRAILEAGKHAYSEKPMVLDLAEGLALRDLATARGLRLGTAPDTFLGGVHQQARALLDGGEIGTVLSGTAHVMSRGMEAWHPNPDFFFQPGGGPVLDLGPYYLTNLVQLLGPITQVAALAHTGFATRTIGTGPRAGEAVPVDTPTTLHALLRFASGALVTFGASWDVVAHGHGHLELYGSDGTLFVPDPNYFGGTLGVSDGTAPRAIAPWTHPLGRANEGAQANYRMAGLADMVAALHAGRPHRCGADLGLHVVEAMTAILTSAQTGAPVPLSTTCARPAPLSAAEATALLR